MRSLIVLSLVVLQLARPSESHAMRRPHWVKALINEAGATAIEYALIGSLIAVIILASVTSVGREVGTMFSAVSSGLQTANSN